MTVSSHPVRVAAEAPERLGDLATVLASLCRGLRDDVAEAVGNPASPLRRRSAEWKSELLSRYFASRVGSDRIRSEWGIRAALVYLALRRLRLASNNLEFHAQYGYIMDRLH